VAAADAEDLTTPAAPPDVCQGGTRVHPALPRCGEAPPDAHRTTPRGQGPARLPAAPRGPSLPPQTRRHLGRTCGRPVRQDPGHQAASDLPPHRVPRTRNRGHLLRGAVGGRPCSLRLAPCASAPDRCPTTGWKVVATRTWVGVAWSRAGAPGKRTTGGGVLPPFHARGLLARRQLLGG